VTPRAARALRYVALGDSYTIGTAVEHEAGRWPNQLVARLAGTATPLELVANLGVNGFTSADVIATELPRLPGLAIEFASLLVGVNDVVQGVDEAMYRENAARILDALLDLLPSRRVITVATPDYTVTPSGGDYGDPTRQAAAIRRVNAILGGLAAERGIGFVDIHDLSLRAGADRSLVAADGLHPSAAQYALWVDRIAPAVSRSLASGSSDQPG
jgi:lysophospholipase L1-like esterase